MWKWRGFKLTTILVMGFVFNILMIVLSFLTSIPISMIYYAALFSPSDVAMLLGIIGFLVAVVVVNSVLSGLCIIWVYEWAYKRAVKGEL